MDDLGIGNHTGWPVPIRPLFPHHSHAYTLGACHILWCCLGQTNTALTMCVSRRQC